LSDTAVIFDIIGRDRTGPAIGSSGSAFNKLALGMAAGAAFAGEKMVNMAANFQQSMTRVATGAGELQGNMHMVSEGVLNMSGEVGQSTQHLTAALYTVESASYHGADALTVLHAAAEGAKVGNAELATVADAVTTSLNAYHLGAKGAVDVTNALIGAESQGKTTMEALAGSLATVLPTAAAAGVGLNEVLGAMSTMTAEGTSADNAATYLRMTIGQLSNPSNKAAQEMKNLGLSATQVGQNLGKNGLASTLTMLTNAIEKHMGPAGLVLIKHLQGASKNTTEFQRVLANLPPTQQTYIGALATMVGGTKSMQAALELTGDNMATFQANTAAVNQHVADGAGKIEGWDLVQKNFNQRLAETKDTVLALGVRIGGALLPQAQKALNVISSTVSWLTKHKAVAKDAAIAVGLMAAAFVGYRIAVTVATVAEKVWTVAKAVGTAIQWLWNAAMDANPIGLIIIGIMLLVGGFILLWTHSAAFRNFFIGMWSAIWGFLKAVGAWFAGPFAHFFVDVWHAIAGAAMWLWHTILKPIFDAWMSVVGFVYNIVKSFAALWWFAFKNTIGASVLWLWHSVIEPWAAAVAGIALWLWHNVLDPVWGGIKSGLRLLGEAFQWMHDNVWMPVWHAVAAVVDWGWKFIKEKFDLVMGVVHTVGDTFKSVFSSIGGFISGAFSSAVGVAKSEINALIDMINTAVGFINHDVIDVANKVPNVSFPHIPSIPHLATGGIVQVGERGTEIVRLPSGSTVYPHGSGPADMAGGGAMTLRAAPGDVVAETLLAILRPVIRTRYGGNLTDALAGAR
jgi:TP901 family phage tail tape measure protein